MKKVASIDVDSYPVGLDISNDGRFVIVTSQGRGNSGTSGNAVNIYEVEYAEPEPVLKHTDGAAVLELLNEGDDGQKPMASVDEKEENVGKSLLQKADGFMNYVWLGGGAAIVVLALLAHALFARKRMDKSWKIIIYLLSLEVYTNIEEKGTIMGVVEGIVTNVG